MEYVNPTAWKKELWQDIYFEVKMLASLSILEHSLALTNVVHFDTAEFLNCLQDGRYRLWGDLFTSTWQVCVLSIIL